MSAYTFDPEADRSMVENMLSAFDNLKEHHLELLEAGKLTTDHFRNIIWLLETLQDKPAQGAAILENEPGISEQDTQPIGIVEDDNG